MSSYIKGNFEFIDDASELVYHLTIMSYQFNYPYIERNHNAPFASFDAVSVNS